MNDKVEDVKLFLRDENHTDKVFFFEDYTSETPILHLPSNTVDKNEDPIDAAIRNMREEANVFLNNYRKLFEFNGGYQTVHFYETCYEGDIKLDTKNKKCRWLGEDDLDRYLIASNDDRAAHIYLEGVEDEMFKL